MKKQLFLLPLLAGFVLTGCKITIGDKTITFLEKKQQENNSEVEEDTGALPSHMLEKFEGYKLARKVKNGGRYLLGVYRTKEDLMRFANGEMHKDSKGSYPFYLETVAGTVQGAAEVEVKFVSDDEFTLQVFAPGKAWDQKYIGIYNGLSIYDKQVVSIAMLDSTDQTKYTCTAPDKNGNPKTETYTEFDYKFKFLNEFEGNKMYTPVVYAQYAGLADEEATPKFMGTGHAKSGADYTSIDSKNTYEAVEPSDYDLVHLYEKL